MASSRLSVVLAAVADALRDGAPSGVASVSRAAISLVSLSGAGVSLMADGKLRGTAGVVGQGIAAVQELQLTLGEGPGLDAWNTGAPVLEPELEHPDPPRWPAFAPEAVGVGIRAVFALPVGLGAIRIGALVLCRDRPGVLTPDELAMSLVLADVATHAILGLQAGAEPGALHRLLADEPAHWQEVHQATGMLSVQLGVTLDEAFVRLRAHAFANAQPLRRIAADVVARRLLITNQR